MAGETFNDRQQNFLVIEKRHFCAAKHGTPLALELNTMGLVWKERETETEGGERDRETGGSGRQRDRKRGGREREQGEKERVCSSLRFALHCYKSKL